MNYLNHIPVDKVNRIKEFVSEEVLLGFKTHLIIISPEVRKKSEIFTQFEEITKSHRILNELLSSFDKMLRDSNEAADVNAMVNDVLLEITQFVHDSFWNSRECLCDYILGDERTLTEIFFENTPNISKDIDKSFRKMSRYFDENRTINSQKSKVREIMTRLNSARDEKKSMVEDEDCMNEVVKNSFSQLEKWISYMKYLNSDPRDEKLLSTADFAFKNFSHFTKEEISLNIRIVSQDVVKYLHALIRMVDRRDSQLDTHLRIAYRMKVATCYQNLNYLADAQVSLIGALHIAYFVLEEDSFSPEGLNQEQIIKAIKAAIEAIKIQAMPATTTAKPQSDNKLKSRIPKNSKLGKKHSDPSLDALRSNDIINSTFLRADGQIVRSGAANEYIVAANQEALNMKYAGAAFCTVGVSAALTVSTLAAIGLAEVAGLSIAAGAMSALCLTNPVGWIVLGLFTFNGVYFGWGFVKKGRDMAREPTIRQNLNKSFQESLVYFEEGDVKNFLLRLSQPYDGQKCLFICKENHAITFDCSLIISELVDHGWLPDGIGYLLNLIAEVISSGKIKCFGEESHLLAQAKLLYASVISSEQLTNLSNTFDENIMKYISKQNFRMPNFSIFQSSSNRTSARYATKLIDGIPESYLSDEVVGPSSARLEEVRNIARLNKAIIHITIGHEDEMAIAATLLKELKNSAHNQFRYFSVSDHRLSVVEDIIRAFGFDENDDDESTPAPILFDHITTFMLGEMEIPLSSSKTLIEDNSSVVDVLTYLGIHGITVEECIARLTVRIKSDEEDSFWYDGDGNPFPVPLSQETIELQYTLGLLQEKMMSLAAFEVKREFASKKHLKIMSALFGVAFIRCKIMGEHFIPLDKVKSDCDFRKVIFLYIPNFSTVSEDGCPVRAFRVNDSLARNPQTLAKDIKVQLIQLGESCWDDAMKECISESEKIKLISDAEKYFRQALEDTDLLSFNIKAKVAGAMESVELTDQVTSAYLSYIECRIAFAKYAEAKRLLSKVNGIRSFQNSCRYWYLLSLSYRKSFEYGEAALYINRAAQLCNNSSNANLSAIEVGKYRAVITKELLISSHLRNDRISSNAQATVVTQVQDKFGYSARECFPTSAYQHVYYDILSIDGGGIKGIIPALWLSILEKKINRPLSNVIDHFAGTSTGAIIAAGLTVPLTPTATKPKYSAHDILMLYVDPTKSSRIFQKTWHILGIFGAKYNADGRGEIVKEYFGDTTIQQSLSNLTVASYCEETRQETIFSKQLHSDIFLSDAVLASSAAQTFFPSHVINEKHYTDAGPFVNNPGRAAYNSAKKLCGDRKIRFWSLGCGDFIPNYASHNQGALFYASEIVNQSIANQQRKVDEDLSSKLKENYSRWQVWFEKDMAMDDIGERSVTTLIEIGKQLVEDNEDGFNRMVEALTEKF